MNVRHWTIIIRSRHDYDFAWSYIKINNPPTPPPPPKNLSCSPTSDDSFLHLSQNLERQSQEWIGLIHLSHHKRLSSLYRVQASIHQKGPPTSAFVGSVVWLTGQSNPHEKEGIVLQVENDLANCQISHSLSLSDPVANVHPIKDVALLHLK